MAEDDEEKLALDELLLAINSMALSQQKLVEIAQALLKEARRSNKA
jgi:hypothetical protein